MLSIVPGTSGRDLVLSIEDPSASPSVVRETAQEASGIVNETAPSARVDRWIEDEHTAACPDAAYARSAA